MSISASLASLDFRETRKPAWFSMNLPPAPPPQLSQYEIILKEKK